MTIELPIEREQPDGSFKEIIAEAEFDYNKASRGSRDKYGAQEEPDEPASLEFIAAIDMETGKSIELTDSEIEEAESAAWDKLAD